MKKTWEILNYSLNPGAVFRKRDSGLEKKSRNPLCLKSYLWHLDTISSWLGSTFLSQAVQSSKNPSSSLHLPFSPPLSSITLPLLLFLPPLSAPLFFLFIHLVLSSFLYTLGFDSFHAFLLSLTSRSGLRCVSGLFYTRCCICSPTLN